MCRTCYTIVHRGEKQECRSTQLPWLFKICIYYANLVWYYIIGGASVHYMQTRLIHNIAWTGRISCLEADHLLIWFKSTSCLYGDFYNLISTLLTMHASPDIVVYFQGAIHKHRHNKQLHKWCPSSMNSSRGGLLGRQYEEWQESKLQQNVLKKKGRW